MRKPRTGGHGERKCAFCGRPHVVSERVAQESPFCQACLPERVARREVEVGPTLLTEAGDYVVISRLQPGTPDAAPS